ncbi:LOW QUALITY PROTEIN: uncharacterized protein ACJ7VT_017470 [Polymixia lowei]
MAQQGIQMDRSKFCCSICLDILRDPVTIPCGHSYCGDCIKNCWDEEDHKGIHSCPQCRQTFIPRPAVFKSTMLAELVEELEKTGLQTAPPDHCYAGPGDVACDVCTGRKLKALKFCQVCLVSYCEQHLQRHYDVAPLRKHKLVEASTEIQENICSRHDEVMKIFCRTDQQCICYLCAMDEHKGHDTISAVTERTERQKELCVSQKNILERIQKQKKDVKVLQQKVENINCSADKAVENSDRIFTELIRSIERRRSEVKEQIRTQQKAEVSRTEKLQKQKEQQIAELRRRNTELELLSHTEDHIHFLQKYPSLSCLSEYKDLPSTDICPLQYFEDVAVAMSKTRDKVEDILKQEVPEILLTVTKVDVLLSTSPESTTRDDYLRYSRQIKLDPNTAHVNLFLSKGNRKVTLMLEEELYPRHPDRFINTRQVLSTEGLTGRCYWEVEWSGGDVSIAVSYKNINRGGDYNECGFGHNNKSWALQSYSNSYEFKHNNITTPITGPRSSRVGVYLDYRAGTLCFYSVSETMTLLHRVQTTFTQPLYPGVCKMAQQGIQMDRSKFCCSICLDILRDPVTIPCGHSYCMDCIKNCDQEDQRGIHRCPQCRQTFIPRPPVVKNTMLAEIVEELEKTGLQAAPPDHCYAGPRDVACDVCTGRKLKALKFCQVCLVSYCEQHLQRHYDVAPLRKHKLVEASTEIQENICSRHDEVMKIFCRTDQQCICYLCAMDEHKGHDIISAVTERTERQKELCVSQKNILERIQKQEKDVKVLQQEVENINCSADKAVENSDRIFTELIRSIERRHSEVKEQIRTQQKAEVSRTEELQKQKEQQIAELRRRNTELEQLSHTENHIHFLQKYPSLSCLSEYKDLPSTDICPLQYFEDVAVAMSKTRDKVEDILKEEVPEILLTVTKVDVLLSTPPESTTRDDYLRYSRQIKLDPNTAHVRLSLSEGNRKVTMMREEQLYPRHPERFIKLWQVLSTEGLTGRCYWEVEWSGFIVSIAVSYKNINRGGNYKECGFGNNDKSWALQYFINRYEFKHNNITTPIKGPRSSRVGVYLDYRAGTLCFYSVSETMTLLHRVQTTFTQPLYPGVWFSGCYRDSAELCLLK